MIFRHLSKVSPVDYTQRAETLGSVVKSLHDLRESVLSATTEIAPLHELRTAGPLAGCSVILGVPDDRGVLNNKGNGGAQEGPEAFRKAFYKLYDSPLPLAATVGANLQKGTVGLRLVDAGNLVLAESIQESHERLAECVRFFLLSGASRVFVIGGGHDFSYGSYKGHVSAVGGLVPIVNLDAHLDLRPLINGVVNSGTPFYRVVTELSEHILSGQALLELGIQRERNPHSLFQFALEKEIPVVEFSSLLGAWKNRGTGKETTPLNHVLDHLDNCRSAGWSREFGRIHLSVDLDVFHNGIAPGTSASTSMGASISELRAVFSLLGKMAGCSVVDVAELCPARDVGERTASLAASLIYQLTVLQASKPC